MHSAGKSIVPVHANGNGTHHVKSHDRQIVPETQVVEYSVQHGLSGKPRVRISWGTGNHIRLSFLPPRSNGGGRTESGKVVEITLGPQEQDEAEERRVASASLPYFAMLQSQRQSMGETLSGGISHRLKSNWWEEVLEYSRNISSVLEAGGASPSPSSSLSPPRVPPGGIVEKSSQELRPTATMRAIWDLLEIFYVDKGAESWLAERLVEWLLTHSAAFSVGDQSLKARLVGIKRNMSETLFPEGESFYWEAIASALAVGWLDFVVKLLRLHGSYRHDQIDDRQTENGLVEAVAVLVSKMPRLRPSIPYEDPGIAYKFKPEFAKEWERWKLQVGKLERSGFWSDCHHKGTLYGLRRLLEILQGNDEALVTATSHWIELLVAKCLHVRPFTAPSEGLLSLVRGCVAAKSDSSSTPALRDLLQAIMVEDTEIVIAECAKNFPPWLMAHIVDLLKAKSSHSEDVLQRESVAQGGITLEEFYRISYAQALASHPLTWQLAHVYLAWCPKQGLGMLETLLLRLPVVGDDHLALKAMEVCRLYDLQAVRSSLCRRLGVYNWKHGLWGAAIVWLQRAKDVSLLSSLSDQLLASVSAWSKRGQSETIEQMEVLVDLLGTEFQAASGGLSFLRKYQNFKSALQTIWEMRSSSPDEQQKLAAAGRQAATSLTELFTGGITPKRFWMPLLQDAVELLEWPEQVLLDPSETNLLLNCTQELRLANLRGDLENVDLKGPALERVRLALATNLSRAFIQV